MVTVKGNQPNLLSRIIDITQDISKLKSIKQEEELNRGRRERRRYELYVNPEEELQETWSGMTNIIKVHRQRNIGEKHEEETIYYINNKREAEIEELSKGIRNHWLIENSLHWVKDVTFGEDKKKYKAVDVSEKMSIMITLAINILRKNEDKYLKRTMRLYCNKIKKLKEMLE